MDRQLAMLHAVPEVLAKNKDLAECFQEHWNRLVSPGNIHFTQRGEGREFLLDAAGKGLLANEQITTKEFFR